MNVLQKLLRGNAPEDDRPDADAAPDVGGAVTQAAHIPGAPAQAATTRETLQAEIETLRAQYQEALAQHRSEQAEARVEKWIGCGYLPPACREQARALVMAAPAVGIPTGPLQALPVLCRLTNTRCLGPISVEKAPQDAHLVVVVKLDGVVGGYATKLGP